MLKNIILTIIEAIRQNGAISVFWGGIIEQVTGVLIPSVLIPITAGFLLIPQDLAFLPGLIKIFWEISLPYTIAATIGTSIFYLIARYGGRALIEKYGKFFGLSIKTIDRFKNKFTRGFKDELIIFFLIALPATSISLIAASCGFIGITAWEFYPLIFIGIFVRSVFLAWLGWQAGESHQLIISGLDKAESLLTILIATVGFAFLAFLYYRRQKTLD